MHGWMNSGSWMWMSFMMVFWLVALGAIIYGAVRLGSRRPDDKAVEREAKFASTSSRATHRGGDRLLVSRPVVYPPRPLNRLTCVRG